MHNEYAELRQIVKERGLLDKQPFYYVYKFTLIFALLALSLMVLVFVEKFWLQMLNAAFLAFVFGQIAFLGHDTGHRQVIDRRDWRLTALENFISFILGTSSSSWVNKHNKHHGNPNNLELDPDINLPLIAFSEGQARTKRGINRIIAAYQGYLITPLLFLEGMSLRMASVRYLISRKKAKHPKAEFCFMLINWVIYSGGVFFLLGVFEGFMFIIIHQALFGFYMGSVFAPNHKGMPLIDDSNRTDFLREQVLTARNIKSNPVIEFLYGGLDYQIEHHLFPNMPRNKLREAQKIVKPFCKSKGIAYCEETVFGSYIQILSYLHQVSAPLRQKKM